MRSLTLGIVRLFVKRLGLKIRNQLLFSTRFFNLSLVAGNDSKRQISVSGDLLLWLRIAFGGSFLFFDTKKKINGSYFYWDYSFIVERRGRFLKLFLILGQVVLDAEVAKFGVEKKEEGADFETAALPENPKARTDHLFPIYWPGILQYCLQYWPGILQYWPGIVCRGINIFHHRRMAAAVFCCWLEIEHLELEEMSQSCFYFWLILENRKI